MEEVDVRDAGQELGSEAGGPVSEHPSPADAVTGTQQSGTSGDSVVPAAEVERLRGELQEARTRWLEAHRRALLAENAGRVVPELVAGTSPEELERSVEVARRAFDAARAATLAEIAATPVPAGNPIRRGPDPESMSPMEKIAHGLKRD